MVSALLVWLVPMPARAEEQKETRQPWFLHCNGIGGERVCDHTLLSGLTAGGFEADFHIYDWTEGETGIVALQRHDQHPIEARKVADLIIQAHAANPGTPIFLSCHSGGTAIITWALEILPDEVKVESIVMFAPALSPEYDLTKALRHVKNKLYVFSSPHDFVVLSTGTKMFGTMDGVRCEAAGLKGFVQPKSADAEQYRKIVPQPYQRSWAMRYGNVGSHICGMRTKFARDYVAKLLLTGKPPVDEDAAAGPTTRPVEAKAALQ
ncbi:MAG TPA: hypothetical protein VGQ99_00550 [Tepidisphaeraceae bacterium]|jgi:hypothetical protein|nr:hypothetical protein [Tepidisphaeraceae bacterium]